MRRKIWTGAVGVSLAALTVSLQAATTEPVYRVQDEILVTGRVTSVTTIPDWMGKDGVNIALSSRDASAPHVDIATAAFLRTMDFAVAVGDDLVLTGCWSQGADGSPVFLVHQLRKDKVTLNVRDPRGIPLW